MRRLLLIIPGLLVAGFVLLWRLSSGSERGDSSLTVYCAAGLRTPVEAAAEAYRREFGTEVRLQYGGSGALLGTLRVSGSGDLYIAADDGTLAEARQLKLVREAVPLATQRPVIAVARGNPKGISRLADLLRGDVRVALTNPETASNGRLVREVLGRQWEPLAARARTLKPTVTEIAQDVTLDAVDAAVVWDSTVGQFEGLETVRVPELTEHPENASAAVLETCAHPAEALEFARYLAAPERGGAVFRAQGFEPVEGDRWDARPELVLYSGGVNRLAIEPLLQSFQEREGVAVTTVFNGCGILCASIQTMADSGGGKLPDAYYACDVCFLPPVAHFFPEAFVLTETDIVIVVQPGNPHGIDDLRDLAAPGLRLGVCNAEQATLGYMTRGMLRSEGLTESVGKNVRVEVPTADFLINQMRAGALDAAIVYRVNAAPVQEHLQIVPIDHPGAVARQPFAVRATSPRRQLAGRLLSHFRAHHADFEAAGFRWLGEERVLRGGDIDLPPWLSDTPKPAKG
jgi:molybdenum ABC transporter molybdate-binding protein